MESEQELVTSEGREPERDLVMSATYRYSYGTDASVMIHLEYRPDEFVLDPGAIRTVLLDRYLSDYALWTGEIEWIDSLATFFYDELCKELYPTVDHEDCDPPLIVEIEQTDPREEQHYASIGSCC